MSNSPVDGAPASLLRIAVVYALPQQQSIVDLRLPPTATVMDAVQRSGLVLRHPELTDKPLTCAIFSRIVPLTAVLRDGDRVEILRPLLIDPKENRRQTAARARKNSAKTNQALG